MDTNASTLLAIEVTPLGGGPEGHRHPGSVAAFLASQDSSFMTASEVAVDGGLAQI